MNESSKKDMKELAGKWEKELSAAKKWFRKFQKRGEKVIKAFLDENANTEEQGGWSVCRLNLFHANIITLMSMLYGRIPKVDVSRRFADAEDDVARVAGEILTRILNTDIEVAGEDIASVFRSCLQDRLLPGLGTARLQYKFIEGKGEKIEEEWTDVTYTHWKDVLWSPARIYSELRWKAYRSFLTKPRFKERFPKAKLEQVNFSSRGALQKVKSADQIEEQAEAEVWEIWDKEHLCVYWWTEGYPEMLDHSEDPLELEGFWPDPPPLIANVTTTNYLPKADYDLARDLYREIDELESRISLLTEACKCVGVYDSSNEGVQRIFNEGVENQLIPVKNWAQFTEKGGLEGTVQWVPLEDVVNTIDVLTRKQNDKIQQLYQVTGMNDVMRGAAMKEGTPVTATERKIQDNYGSIRIEALQNEFARWVSDTQAIKAEIIAKHYQDYCIIQQSNIMSTADGENQELIKAAIDLIKDPTKARWKITVRPETLAIADYAQLKADRIEFIMGLAQFMQSAAPLMELEPGALPTLMKLLKWGLAGFRGSNEIEGILDQEITKLAKQPPQEKPNPEAMKAQAEIQKMQMEMQIEQQKSAAELQQAREKHQADMQLEMVKLELEKQKMQLEIVFMTQKFQLELQKMQAELGIKVETAKVEAEAQAAEQAAQFAFNTAERRDEMQAEKEDREHEAAIQMESGEQELRRDKERAALKPRPNGDAGS